MNIKKHVIYSSRLFNKMKKAEKNEKNKKNFKYFLVAESLFLKGLRLLKSYQKLKNKKYLKKIID